MAAWSPQVLDLAEREGFKFVCTIMILRIFLTAAISVPTDVPAQSTGMRRHPSVLVMELVRPPFAAILAESSCVLGPVLTDEAKAPGYHAPPANAPEPFGQRITRDCVGLASIPGVPLKTTPRAKCPSKANGVPAHSRHTPGSLSARPRSSSHTRTG